VRDVEAAPERALLSLGRLVPTTSSTASSTAVCFWPPAAAPAGVTVLFTDIRDYTTLTEQLDAEDVVESQRVVRRGDAGHSPARGIVNQFHRRRHHVAVRRARTARGRGRRRRADPLDIRDALVAFNPSPPSAGAAAIRTAWASIPAACGRFVGSHQRQTYTAVATWSTPPPAWKR